jgi:hypothetical protein
LEFIRAGGEEAQVVDIQETTDPQVLAFVEDCGTGEFPFQVIYQVCSKDSKKGGAQPATLGQASEDRDCLVGGNAGVQDSQFNTLKAVAEVVPHLSRYVELVQ